MFFVKMFVEVRRKWTAAYYIFSIRLLLGRGKSCCLFGFFFVMVERTIKDNDLFTEPPDSPGMNDR